MLAKTAQKQLKIYNPGQQSAIVFAGLSVSLQSILNVPRNYLYPRQEEPRHDSSCDRRHVCVVESEIHIP